jgi:hypothetical protein
MTTPKPRILGYVSLVILLIGGSAGSVWCFSHHLCMAGHMDHSPYPTREYVADAAWSLAFVAIPIISWRLHLFGQFWRVTLLVLLFLGYRFFLGSLGGRGVFGLPI